MPFISCREEKRSGLLYVRCDIDGSGELSEYRSLFGELRELLERYGSPEHAGGIVILVGSDPENCFGYPVSELLSCDQSELRRFCFEAQDTIKMIKGLSVPTWCLLENAVAGPSLEIALACDKRIMALDSGSSIRFPEIGMGMIAPLGGIFELVLLLGVSRVLDLVETCAVLSPEQALELGVVDHLARADVLEETAALLAADRQNNIQNFENEGPESLTGLLTRLWRENRIKKILRIRAVSKKADKSLNPGIREAFLGFLEMMREGISSGVEEGLLVGVRNFLDLLSSEPNRNLLSLSNKKLRLRGWIGELSGNPAAGGRIVTVLGDCRRSVEWAVKFASRGFAVRYVSDDTSELTRLLKGRFTGGENALRNIFPSGRSDRLSSSDLVVVATEGENMEETGRWVGRAVDGTSSSVPVVLDLWSAPFLVSEIPFGSKHRIYGVSCCSIHEHQEIIELSFLDDIQEEGLSELLSFFTRLGPTIIMVRESPGGLCQRILTGYLTEALRLVEEGGGILKIEEAALSTGSVIGPFWILDHTGLSEYLETSRFLNVRFGQRFEPPGVLSVLQNLGIQGRSGAKGFYIHSEGDPYLDEDISTPREKNIDQFRYEEVIRERLLFTVIGEAMRAFGEGVASHPEVIDVAVDSLGIFPSHLGGPLHYVSQIGTARLVRKFEQLHRNWGVQFEPPELLYSDLTERPRSRFVVGNRT